MKPRKVDPDETMAYLEWVAAGVVVCLLNGRQPLGYETGTSAWARAGTREHDRRAVKRRFAGET